MTDSGSLWQRLRKGGPAEIVYEAIKFGWTTWLVPAFAGMGVLMAGIASWFSGIDALPKLAFFFFVVGCSIWIARQIADTLRGRQASNLTSEKPTPLRATRSPRTFSAWISSGEPEHRAVDREVDGNLHYIVECTIASEISTTVREIVVQAHMRSWREKFLTHFKDVGPLTIKPHATLSLHPGLSTPMVLIEASSGENAKIYLGGKDHCKEDKDVVDAGGRHFITVYISALDTPTETKNFVIYSSDQGELFVVEHDSRRWGHGVNAPTPFVPSRRVTQ